MKFTPILLWGILLITSCSSKENKIEVKKNEEIYVSIPEYIDESLLLSDDIFRVSDMVIIKPDAAHSESLISDIASVKKFFRLIASMYFWM